MRFFRRSLVALGVAAMLPTVVFAAVGIFYFLRAEGRRVEEATLGRSESVMMLADAALQRELAALNVLSTSIYFETREWETYHSRLQRVRAANPQWATIVLLDLQTNQEIFDVN